MSDKRIYNNNPNLPAAGAEFEYTPKKIKQLNKAKQNILYFAENFFYIIDLDKGKTVITLRPYQKRILRKMRDNRFSIVLSSRQSGKTTVMTIFALWIACFNKDQKILVVANKEGTAKEIFSRIRMAYEQLPNWLKPGIESYGRESMELANGSRIGISTTTGSAARGQSCNCLILDELAFIEDHIAKEFWKSVFPIISASKKSRILISSTPNGTGNLFHQLWTSAMSDDSGWVGDKVPWTDIPGRDAKWKDEQIRNMGSAEMFEQEFGCSFLGSGDSSINEVLFESLKGDCFEPEHIFEDGNYRVWESPDSERTYIAGVDVSEGLGKDYSIINVLDVTELTDIRQVALYETNDITPYNFVSKTHEILQHWGSPLTCIERNNCGAQIIDGLKYNLNYENLVTYGNAKARRKNEKIGIISHTNVKFKGITNMRYWINDQKAVRLRDIKTVKELKNFVRNPNGTWSAKEGEGMFDDRVMALVWSLLILNSDLVKEYFEVVEEDVNKMPLIIRPMDYGLKKFVDPHSIYNRREMGDSMPLPMMLGGEQINNDINDLYGMGFRPLDEDNFHHDAPDHNILF